MREIEPEIRNNWKNKALIAVTIIALLGLPLGFVTLVTQNEQLEAQLERLNKANRLLTQNVDSLSNEIEVTRGKTEGLQKNLNENTRDRIQATERERRLQERLASLTDELAQAKTRNQILSTATPQDRLKELDAQTENVFRNLKPLNVREAWQKSEGLLPAFERVSDDFTRPKVYCHHELLKSRNDIGTLKNSSSPAFLLLETQADSSGEVFIANVTYFKLLVVHDDKVIAIDDMASLRKFVDSLNITPTTKIACRAEWGHKDSPDSTKEIYERGDFTLGQKELRALKATFELGDCFTTLDRFK
jgi:hypothetical protein